MDRVFCDDVVIIQHEEDRVDVAQLVDQVRQDHFQVALTGRDAKFFSSLLKSRHEAAYEADGVIVIRIQRQPGYAGWL
jgi:hypothetical protein